jgi:hypothetical protein
MKIPELDITSTRKSIVDTKRALEEEAGLHSLGEPKFNIPM